MSANDMRGMPLIRSGLSGSDLRHLAASRSFVASDMDGLVELDPYFADTVLLVRGHGLNGSKDIVDSSALGSPIVVTGSTAISTARFKWRGSSIKGGGSGSYFTATIGAAGLMRGDFTFELWTQSASNNVLFYSSIGGGYLYNDLWQSYGGPNLAITTTSGGGDTWRHLAVSRAAGVLRSFVNGAQQDFQSYSGSVDLQTLVFGYYVPGNNLFFPDNYSEIRITRDQARYVNDFVAPTGPFPGLF